MSFITDKQTLEDLGLPGKFRPNSVFSMFNQVKTAGGERMLHDMFHQPLTDAAAINKRVNDFKFFQQTAIAFPLEKDTCLLAENYLHGIGAGNSVAGYAQLLRWKIAASLLHDTKLEQLLKGFNAMRQVLLAVSNMPRLDIAFLIEAKQILADRRLSWLSADMPTDIPLVKIARYDYVLRHAMRAEMERLMQIVFQLDLCIAVSNVAAVKGWAYAEMLQDKEHRINADELWHPSLKHAVANPISLSSHQNLLFLTGANMAGKSTFMKAFGIAVYMAHIGFPVAAKGMRLSVCGGLYSSINLPDNLEMGLSHFYAEVLRVKTAAQQVAAGKNMVVVFDELFKGTNVKDAYDATLAITAAFSEYRHCFFITSTHIIEVAEELKKRLDNIRFAYMPTVMKEAVPTYPYQLVEGITGDRQGMIIIENEGIPELLNA